MGLSYNARELQSLTCLRCRKERKRPELRPRYQTESDLFGVLGCVAAYDVCRAKVEL
jgi:hypothetical protein